MNSAAISERPRHRHIRAVLAAAVVTAGIVGFLFPVPFARAQATGAPAVAFSSLASAQAFRVTYTVPNYVIVSEIADVGAPVAQAILESSGLSRAFASAPYAGDTVVSAPGLVAGATGAPVSPPDFPGYAAADHPGVPEKEVSDPSKTYMMRATAKERASEGTARIVAPGIGAGSTSHSIVTRAPDGTVTALSETITEGLSFEDGLLRIASVRSKSVTTLTPGSVKPVTKSELDIDGASVAGQRVGITTGGIVLGSQTIPVPVAEVTKALNEALKSAGLSVRLVEGAPIAGGRTADALEVRSEHTVPVPGEPKGYLTYRFGGASSAIIVGAAAIVTPVVESPQTPVAEPASIVAGETFAAPPATEESAPAPMQEAAAAPAGSGQPVAIARDMRDSVRIFYLVLGVGGGLLLGGATRWRRREEIPWTF